MQAMESLHYANDAGILRVVFGKYPEPRYETGNEGNCMIMDNGRLVQEKVAFGSLEIPVLEVLVYAMMALWVHYVDGGQPPTP